MSSASPRGSVCCWSSSASRSCLRRSTSRSGKRGDRWLPRNRSEPARSPPEAAAPELRWRTVRCRASGARTAETGMRESGPASVAGLRGQSYLGHGQVCHVLGFRLPFRRHVEQAHTVVGPEPAFHELVHIIRRDATVAIDLLVQQRRITKVGGEERQLVGAFPGRLHRCYKIGLDQRDGSLYLGAAHAVGAKCIDLPRDLTLQNFRLDTGPRHDIDDQEITALRKIECE